MEKNRHECLFHQIRGTFYFSGVAKERLASIIPSLPSQVARERFALMAM